MTHPKKLSVKEIAKLKTDPLFDDLPEELKDSARYVEIERRLAQAVYSDHSHKSVKQYVTCKRCRPKMDQQRALKKEIGFTSQEQYLQWKRIMSIIIAQSDIHLP